MSDRRPATAAGARDGPRMVELRQGNVGPLSSLLVTRPATPQPRTSRGNKEPPASSNGRQRTADQLEAVTGDHHAPQWHDSESQQRFVTHFIEDDCRKHDSSRQVAVIT